MPDTTVPVTPIAWTLAANTTITWGGNAQTDTGFITEDGTKIMITEDGREMEQEA